MAGVDFAGGAAGSALGAAGGAPGAGGGDGCWAHAAGAGVSQLESAAPTTSAPRGPRT
jgi:hypothetical protein